MKLNTILACYFNFCNLLKKIRYFSDQSGLRGSNKFRVGRKMENFELYFSVHGTRGSPTWPHPEIMLGDQDIESTGRPVSNGLQVPGEKGFFHAKTSSPW